MKANRVKATDQTVSVRAIESLDDEGLKWLLNGVAVTIGDTEYELTTWQASGLLRGLLALARVEII